MLEKEEKKRKKARVSRKKRQEKKRVKDMTERVVCEVRRMFSKRTPSPYDFEKEMREWLEREERKRRRRRTRKKRGGVINKISIPINWDSDDCGYKILRNKKVKTFLSQNFKKGNNLIQTFKPFKGNGKTILHLRAIPVKSWPIKISWGEIKCKHYKNWLKATPCDWGSTRIFAKLKSNKKIAAFGLYLDKLIYLRNN